MSNLIERSSKMRFQKLIYWLLRGDPAIRYQLHRDILGSDSDKLKVLKANMINQGWVKRLLDKQNEDGIWGGGLYSPKWISSTYTLLLLKRLSISKSNLQARKGTLILLEKGLNKDGGINFSKTIASSETCITGMVLSLLSYFQIKDERVKNIINYLINEQMSDGGWNCQKKNGAKHSSMHTTINVLEGLLEYKKVFDYKETKIINMEIKAHEFLLQHRLYKSDKTGQIIDRKFTYLSFPPRWYYDILRVLEYFYFYDKEYDNRMDDALNLLIKKKNKDCKWPLQGKHKGKEFFELENNLKESKINTLRALRILKKYKKNL